MLSDAVMAPKPQISVIIPCHNEAKRIEKTVDLIDVYFSVTRFFDLHELILVENGSTDNTGLVLESLQKKYPQLHIKVLISKIGKGNAMKKGVDNAGSQYVLIMDADSSTDISALTLLSSKIENNDIVNTSRRINGALISNEQTFLRRLFGNVFHLLVKSVFSLTVSDTQNGFKLFKTDIAKDLFSSIQTSGWVSEVELFLIAKNKGYRIAEVPVEWRNDSESKLGIKDTKSILRDVWYLVRLYGFRGK